MKLELYINKADKRQVNKTSKMQKVGTVDVKLQVDTDLMNPDFALSGNIADFTKTNYVYCQELNRYYFVSSVRLGLGGIVVLSCHCDVLMSFNKYIRTMYALVSRQENESNMSLPDNQFALYNKRNYTYKKFSTTPFSSKPNGKCFILTTTGGI